MNQEPFDYLRGGVSQTVPISEQQQQLPVKKVSEKTRLVRNLRNWSVYLGCFSGGLTLAFVCRLLPGFGVFYAIAKISIVGYLIAVRPEDATQESLSLRRLAGLAVMVSALAGQWDGMELFATKPVEINDLIFPLWVVAVASVFLVVLMALILMILWRMADDRPQNPFR